MYWKSLVGNRWVEIDTDAIRHNYRQIKDLAGEDVRIIAVVKADAYGLGAVECSKVLAECGADMLAVTTVEEGVELRQGGLTLPVLLLSPFLPDEASLVIKYGLTPAISTFDQLQALVEAGARGQKVHLKIETGLGRTGIFLKDLPDFLKQLAHYPEIEVEGVFTHFAQAKKGDSFTEKQFALFQQAVKLLQEHGLNPPYIHACNSAATLELSSMHCNAVRIGTILFGQKPAQVKLNLELRDPWKLKARVIHVKDIPAGTSVGYGREYIATKNTRIAVIPLGWADGLTVTPAIRPKNLLDLLKMMAKLFLEFLGKAKQTTVRIGGKDYRIVGRLGMQLSMVEVGEEVKAGDELELTMRRLSANPRLPRVYFKDGQAYAVRLAGKLEELKDFLTF